MTRSSLSRSIAITAAFGVLVTSFPAFAQSVKKEPYYDEELVITAPYIRRERTPGVTGGEEVSVSRIVSARDLDLRYASGADELRQRIHDTAVIVCEEAQAELRGPSLESDRECIRDATRGAMAEADDLIAYYRG